MVWSKAASVSSVENGKIAEHWDTIETIPARSEWKNQNGKFGF
ncbi:MAG: hypothetical protein ACJ79S_14465 [Gemmatimonadaceae bacterium]